MSDFKNQGRDNHALRFVQTDDFVSRTKLKLACANAYTFVRDMRVDVRIHARIVWLEVHILRSRLRADLVRSFVEGSNAQS